MGILLSLLNQVLIMQFFNQTNYILNEFVWRDQ